MPGFVGLLIESAGEGYGESGCCCRAYGIVDKLDVPSEGLGGAGAGGNEKSGFPCQLIAGTDACAADCKGPSYACVGGAGSASMGGSKGIWLWL